MRTEGKVKDAMTEGVIAIEKQKTVVEAVKLLEDEHIRGLVVVEDGEAVGVIVCRDVVYEVVAEDRDASNIKVEDVMSNNLLVAEEDEPLNEVAMAMIKNNVSRVPVVRDNMLVGILTQSDLVRTWPGFAEVISEEEEMDAEASPRIESRSGMCENCENYSDELFEQEGILVCPECRDTA